MEIADDDLGDVTDVLDYDIMIDPEANTVGNATPDLCEMSPQRHEQEPFTTPPSKRRRNNVFAGSPLFESRGSAGHVHEKEDRVMFCTLQSGTNIGFYMQHNMLYGHPTSRQPASQRASQPAADGQPASQPIPCLVNCVTVCFPAQSNRLP